MKTIRDAVHGDIEFDSLEMALIDTPAMQRLRGIKQLGASSLVFPSAVHTRFEHSLGTCWITKGLLDSLSRAGCRLSEEDHRTACLAALLHDVTHVPFGHTFEDERRLFDRHDEDPGRLDYFLGQPEVKRVLDESGVSQRVRSMLSNDDGSTCPIRQLVTGTICADLLDYLRRDALFCGLSLGYDERLFQYFHLSEGKLVIRLHKQGAFRRDALSELVHLLQIRYSLTERVYYHHAKIVAGAMISRAVEAAMEAGQFKREELYRLRDDSLLDRLSLLSARVPELGDLMSDLESRRLYKRVYLLTVEGLGRPGLSAVARDQLADRFHRDITTRRQAEIALAQRLDIPSTHVIIYCPSPHMALKEADIAVDVSPEKAEPLSALGHPDVEALTEKHRGLWRFYVCLRQHHRNRFHEAGRLCEELIGHPNHLKPLQRGKLAFPS